MWLSHVMPAPAVRNQTVNDVSINLASAVSTDDEGPVLRQFNVGDDRHCDHCSWDAVDDGHTPTSVERVIVPVTIHNYEVVVESGTGGGRGGIHLKV